MYVYKGNFKDFNLQKFIWKAKEINWEVVIMVKKYYKPRTINQNKYYWGWIITPMANHLWYEIEEMHEIMKYKYLKDKTDDFEYIKRTRDLTTKEFTDYVEKVKNFASTLWIILQSADEYFYN